MHVTGETETSLRVFFVAANINDDVQFYMAKHGNKECQVPAKQVPLSCTLSGLQPGTEYIIQGYSCMSKKDCSDAMFGKGATLPERK